MRLKTEAKYLNIRATEIALNQSEEIDQVVEKMMQVNSDAIIHCLDPPFDPNILIQKMKDQDYTPKMFAGVHVQGSENIYDVMPFQVIVTSVHGSRFVFFSLNF